MIKRLGFAEQCIVRTLCALALLLVGFAHKPPVLANSQIPLREIAQYVLPDGTLPVLCLPSEDGKAKLLFEPFCLVADEPTSRIDPLVQREVIRLLCELVDERGMSLVLTSHDRRLVRAIADEVIELG